VNYDSKVKYFGHPLLNIISKENIQEKNQNDIKVIGLMPGSRKQELNNTIPVFLEIYNRLKDKYDFNFIIPEIWKTFVESNFNINQVKTFYGNSEENMKLCDLIIASSGTVTLEAVIMDIPIIPCYKLNKLSYLIAKMVIKPEYVTLPNLISEKKVINEFLQDNLNSENIISEINKISSDQEYYNNMKKEFKNIRKKLEPFNSIENTAKDIISNYLC
jgi:lipid-A-disaccharide synthase